MHINKAKLESLLTCPLAHGWQERWGHSFPEAPKNTFGESHTLHQKRQAHQQPYKNEDVIQSLPHDYCSRAETASNLALAATSSIQGWSHLRPHPFLLEKPGYIPFMQRHLDYVHFLHSSLADRLLNEVFFLLSL